MSDLLIRSFKGVEGFDGLSVLALAVLLALVTLGACLVPALRASRIGSTITLRAD